VALELTELEDRILMSAVPLAPEAMLDPDSDNDADLAESPGSGTHGSDAVAATTPRQPSDATIGDSADPDASAELATRGAGGRRELVVIDESLSGYEELVRHLHEQAQGPATFDMLTLAADQDGIAQITRALASSDEVDAVHVLAHGSGGALRLGSTWLATDRLAGYAGMIAGWADALAPGADILFYSCDLAATPEGLAVLEGIHALTGADVAASVDATGHASLGGDWELEYRQGDVTTAAALAPAARLHWAHLLSSQQARDDFVAKSFAGCDGSACWTSDWQELGESDGPNAGAAQVADFDLGLVGDHSLQLQAVDGVGVSRTLDLSAATSATLGVAWQRHPTDGFASSVLAIELSADGGNSWSTIASIVDGSDASPTTSFFDVTAFAAADTQVRFLVTGTGSGSVYLDEVRIDFETVLNPPNNAPVLTPGDPLTLSDVLEDDADNSGSAVASILASAGDDRVTDIDAGALEGIAVIGVDDRFGTWQFDALRDGNWHDFANVSDQAAVLLGENSLIRFVPQANHHGPDSQVQFRAWDQTTGSVGDVGVDVSANGGTTAFSADINTASVEVLPADDAPQIRLPATLLTPEDTMLAVTGLSVQSVDAADAAMEVAVSVSHGTLALGTTTGLSFVAGDGTASAQLTFTGLINDINAALASLVYQPDPNFNGQDALEMRASDWTAGGGSQLATTAAVALEVESVNDPPTAFAQHYSVRGDGVLNVAGPGILHNAVDVDGDALSAVVARAPWHGKLELNADGSFRYVPDPGFLGTDSFAYLAWDGQSYSLRTRVFINVLVPVSPVDPGSTVPGNTMPGAPANPPATPGAISGLPVPINAEVSNFMAREREATVPRLQEGELLRTGVEPTSGGLMGPHAQLSVASAGDEVAGYRGSVRAYAADERWDETLAVTEIPAPTLLVDSTAPTGPILPHELTRIEVLLDDQGLWHRWMIGSAVGVTTGLTVGYVLWTIRAGYLLTSLIAQMPTWRFIDPLPILNSFDREALAGDGESLSSIAQAADAHTSV
jgi:hypothetical protein